MFLEKKHQNNDIKLILLMEINQYVNSIFSYDNQPKHWNSNIYGTGNQSKFYIWVVLTLKINQNNGG